MEKQKRKKKKEQKRTKNRYCVNSPLYYNVGLIKKRIVLAEEQPKKSFKPIFEKRRKYL